MSNSDGMYNDWDPLRDELERFAEGQRDADETKNTSDQKSSGAKKPSRNHTGLCRRGHTGHRR